jgi:hypothetical protein
MSYGLGRWNSLPLCGVYDFMTTIIDDSRAELLSVVRSKRTSALRCAHIGDANEEKYWLRVVGQMTEWIEHLEDHRGAGDTPVPSGKVPEFANGEFRR